MKELPPDPVTFDVLRQTAISRAQHASGHLWTDYNLHDPGVTLLEQTSFALTEVAYRAAHETRDLLTGENSELDYPGLALFDPKRVLPSEPVTDLDLAALISDGTLIARTIVSQSKTPGLYDIGVIPNADPQIANPKKLDLRACAHARKMFFQHRPLTCDLHKLTVLSRRPTLLDGQIHISATARPERVAAEVFYHIAAILRGQEDAGHNQHAAKRVDVYDEPLSYLHAPSSRDAHAPELEAHITVLRAIPGVAQIGPLNLLDHKSDKIKDEFDPKLHYRELLLPASQQELMLDLMLDGIPLALNLNQIREEYIRVSADHIAQAQHHLDEAEWSVLNNGRRHSFAQVPVDSLLPSVYRGGGLNWTKKSSANAATSHEEQNTPSLQNYRAAINGQLDEMIAALGYLPQFFASGTDVDSADPSIQRRRIEVLDYLIALQGDEMPSTRNSELHHYRSQAQRYAFEVSWRKAYVDALPKQNAGRGTGPGAAGSGGFLDKLFLLADLQERPHGLIDTARTLGLTLDSEARPAGRRRTMRDKISAFQDVPIEAGTVAPLPPEELLAASPWIFKGSVSSEQLERAQDPDRFSIIIDPKNANYHLLFDGGDPERLICCASRRSKQDINALLARLRESWRQLLPPAQYANLTEGMQQLGLTLSADAPVVEPTIANAHLAPPDNPFDMLVRRDDTAEPLGANELLANAPWINDGCTTPNLFVRTADPKAFIVASTAKSGPYHVLFDAGHPTHLYHCATRAHKSQAAAYCNQIRAGWRHLHEASEGAYLVEDVLLRDEKPDFDAHSATLVLSGWTARASNPAYRTYVTGLLIRLSPAHLHVKPLWLSDTKMALFEDLHNQVSRGNKGAEAKLRTMLTLEAAEQPVRAKRERLTNATRQLDAAKEHLDAQQAIVRADRTSKIARPVE